MRLQAVLAAVKTVVQTPVEDVQFAVPEAEACVRRLGAAYTLSNFELDLLIASLLPSLDDRIGDALVALTGRRTLHAGLAIRALASARPVAQLRDHLSRSALWRSGLLEQSPEPVLERAMVPSAAILDGIEGRLPELPGVRLLQGAPPARPGLSVHPARPTSYALRTIWPAPTAALYVRFDEEPTAATMRAAEQWAVLQARALVADCAGHSTFAVPDDWGSHTDTHLLVEPGSHVRGVRLGATWQDERRMTAAAQRRVFQEVDPHIEPLTLGRLANFTFLREETVRQVSVRARQISGGATPSHAQWVSAIRELSPPPTARFAVTSQPRVPWERLVLPGRPRRQLDALVQRVQQRSVIQGEWGMSSPDGRGDGVVGVLHGESGTGKTFAVEAMATRLGMPVMRVDLSRVVSKYIGETEKHLSELFDRAEGFRSLLFFDEADALFGKRTGVKDAHDRYANIETNYLLQRLELFDGLAILATNLLQNVDEAFLRRLHYVVYFPTPDASARLQLWQQHVPEQHRSRDVDLERLARALDLVGGDIRNAATEAAYRAAAAATPITQTLLVGAISDELLKKGKTPPTNLGGPDAHSR